MVGQTALADFAMKWVRIQVSAPLCWPCRELWRAAQQLVAQPPLQWMLQHVPQYEHK